MREVRGRKCQCARFIPIKENSHYLLDNKYRNPKCSEKEKKVSRCPYTRYFAIPYYPAHHTLNSNSSAMLFHVSCASRYPNHLGDTTQSGRMPASWCMSPRRYRYWSSTPQYQTRTRQIAWTSLGMHAMRCDSGGASFLNHISERRIPCHIEVAAHLGCRS